MYETDLTTTDSVVEFEQLADFFQIEIYMTKHTYGYRSINQNKEIDTERHNSS